MAIATTTVDIMASLLAAVAVKHVVHVVIVVAAAAPVSVAAVESSFVANFHQAMTHHSLVQHSDFVAMPDIIRKNQSRGVLRCLDDKYRDKNLFHFTCICLMIAAFSCGLAFRIFSACCRVSGCSGFFSAIINCCNACLGHS